MSEDIYLLLYELTKDSTPYQPISRWCKDSQFKVEELLLSKNKTKFVPDMVLVTKREFIRDNL
jgi:hypothetical protein